MYEKVKISAWMQKFENFGYICFLAVWPLQILTVRNQHHMDNMEKLTDLLIYSIPLIIIPLALVVGVVLYFLRVEQKKSGSRVKIKNASSVLKIRLQAYERLLLFLERISPQQLVVRNNDPQLSVRAFQSVLIANIREEYEHNLVQQLYISDDAWNEIEQARSWVMKLVNSAASDLDDDAESRELAMVIVEQEMKAGKHLVRQAISKMKNEVRELF